jgi:hypothetical protein
VFGRKKVEQEDPFAALKQGGTYQSAPVTTVAGIPGSGLGDEPTIVPLAAPTPVAPSATPTAPNPAPTPAAQPTPPPLVGATRQTGVRPNRSMRVNSFGMTRASGGTRLIIWLVTLGIIAAIVIPIVSTTSNAIHSIHIPSFSFPSITTLGPGTKVPATPTTPNAHRATNYLKPAGVRSGLRLIAKRFPGASVTNLRLDANSLDAFVFPRHGGVKDLSIASTGTFISSGSSTGEKPIPVSAIPVSAIPRIVSALKRQFHVPPSRIDYTVLSTIPGLSAQWITFSKGPSHPDFAANLDGTGLHRL